MPAAPVAQLNSPGTGSSRAHPRKTSPGAPPPVVFSRKNSPNAAPPAAYPRKNSPGTPANSVFRPFWACRANFFALASAPGRAGRTFSHTGCCNVATLKPMTPLRPLLPTNVKPPSPMLAPKQQPLKPPSPLQPKTTPKTPVSHPQRRCRFQPHARTSEQRRQGFHARDFRYRWEVAGPGCGARGRWRGLPQKSRMQFDWVKFQ